MLSFFLPRCIHWLWKCPFLYYCSCIFYEDETTLTIDNLINVVYEGLLYDSKIIHVFLRESMESNLEQQWLMWLREVIAFLIVKTQCTCVLRGGNKVCTADKNRFSQLILDDDGIHNNRQQTRLKKTLSAWPWV